MHKARSIPILKRHTRGLEVLEDQRTRKCDGHDILTIVKHPRLWLPPEVAKKIRYYSHFRASMLTTVT